MRRRTRFSEEQILAVLREGEAGRKVDELCREHCIGKYSADGRRWPSDGHSDD